MKIQGELTLPRMDGIEIDPGIFLIGEPIPVTGTDKFRCLANILGCLAVIELRITFPEQAAAGKGEGGS